MFDILKNSINSDNTIDRRLDITSFSSIVGLFVNIIIGIGFGVAIISIAYAFIQYTISMGDPKKTEQAFNALIWGILAAGVSILAITLKTIAFKLAGVTDPNFTNVLPNF